MKVVAFSNRIESARNNEYRSMPNASASVTVGIRVVYPSTIGGIGALIYTAGRRGQIPDVFALLMVIIAVGFLQDRLFVYLDQRLFSHKYKSVRRAGSQEINYGIYILLGTIVLYLILNALFGSLSIDPGSVLQYALLIVLVASLVMIAFGEWRVWQSRRVA